MTQQKSRNKAQQHSIEWLCLSIRIIEEFVPLELKRSSTRRRRHLESAYKTLRHHAHAFGVVFSDLSFLYRPEQYLDHAHQVAQALAARFAPEWRRCEKLTVTRARKLTREDYEARSGIIVTREGPAPFVVGDYLAQDSLGEYPIQRATIEQGYVQIDPPDAEGWALYRSTEQREACQQFRAFPTDRGVAGQAGDYLMRGADGRTWPCARATFEREYRFL